VWKRELGPCYGGGKENIASKNTHMMQGKCLSFFINVTNILLKGIVHTKMKILPSFSHPHDDLNLCDVLFHMEDKRRNLAESNFSLVS